MILNFLSILAIIGLFLLVTGKISAKTTPQLLMGFVVVWIAQLAVMGATMAGFVIP
jgi:hypothetical protein